MTRIVNLVITFLVVLFPPAFKARQSFVTIQGVSSDRPCVADFDRIEAVVRADYAGFRDKVQGREPELSVLTDRIRAEVHPTADQAACTAAIRRWVDFFRDRHLAVSESKPLADSGAATGEKKTAAALTANDPSQPSLQFFDDGTAVLRLPSFGNRYKAVIDRLISDNRDRLRATPYLVVDVRGNGGGWTESYKSVIPLLYTDPIWLDGMDAWASPGNIAAVRELIASPQVPEAMRSQARTLLGRMEAAPNTFVTFAEDGEQRLDAALLNPRSVAVLVDRQCASTCEQFVLDARQSRKVKVLGARNTGGLLDYGNARVIERPSGQRRLHVPFTRSRRLPESPMDLIGIAPDVRVRKGEADPIEFARRYLRAAGGLQVPEKVR